MELLVRGASHRHGTRGSGEVGLEEGELVHSQCTVALGFQDEPGFLQGVKVQRYE